MEPAWDQMRNTLVGSPDITASCGGTVEVGRGVVKRRPSLAADIDELVNAAAQA